MDVLPAILEEPVATHDSPPRASVPSAGVALAIAAAVGAARVFRRAP